MHGLGQNMRVFGMITALEMVRNRVMVTPPRPELHVAPHRRVQSLFAHPTVVEYFARLWREGRKFGLICTGISQNTSHTLANAEARDMVLNPSSFLLHKQSTADLDACGRRCSSSPPQSAATSERTPSSSAARSSAPGSACPSSTTSQEARSPDLWNTKP